MARTAARASDSARVVSSGLLLVVVVGVRTATLVFVMAEVEEGGVMVVGAEVEDVEADADVDVMSGFSRLLSLDGSRVDGFL